MVTIKDGCGCDPCDCDWKQKLKEAYARASVSVNKVGDFDGAIYYPDGSGFVKLPIPKLSEVQQISTNAQDIADLKVRDIQLQANITAEETARKAKDENLDSDIARIDSTDARQSELIQDNADRITSTYNDLVSTEATVATHDSDIITLKANNQALAKSLVSDVIMTDGTTAGSVQVSIEREDGALITSANYRWGKDIGIRLEAGTQAGYVKAVISLSDGTELVSNEYKIVEVLESDVYVTAITLIADQAAGTLGGNISYSNGTTQTINSVSVPTAPGVTSAIEALQGRMTAVEQKNTQQDSSISALDSRVKAIEDTPGVGQFAAGKLGTIAGSTTDGRIKAEDDGTGSVNGWSDLKSRVTAAESNIVTAQNDISGIKTKNTQQDTAINGLQTSKINVAQGSANAGKALVVGSDGNVAPGEISGGEVWEEIDYSNPPSDWAEGDRFKLLVGLYHNTGSSSLDFWRRNIVEGEIIGRSFDVTDAGMIPSIYTTNNGYFYPMKASASLDQLNNDKTITVTCSALTISSGGSITGTKGINKNISISDFPNYTETGMGTGTQYLRMWRLKK